MTPWKSPFGVQTLTRAANRLRVSKPPEPDLVHVRREHHAHGLLLRLARCLAGADERAHRVDLARVEQALGFLGDELAHAVLAAGDARDFAETTEEIDVEHGGSLPRQEPRARDGIGSRHAVRLPTS
jgi:hypothetical protein